jgi:Fe-S-cluster containining protein
MNDTIWINPVVKGSCDPVGCGGAACCRVRVFKPGTKEYTLSWCEHFEQTTLKCKIYETRPNGCKIYPTVENLTSQPTYTGCGYYLEESEND